MSAPMPEARSETPASAPDPEEAQGFVLSSPEASPEQICYAGLLEVVTHGFGATLAMALDHKIRPASIALIAPALYPRLGFWNRLLTGLGLGFGYASATPPAIKWFPPSKTGMIAGITFTAGYIVWFKFLHPELNSAEHWLWGISPEGIGVIGMLLNFAVALTVSHFTASPPERIQHMVEHIRVPRALEE